MQRGGDRDAVEVGQLQVEDGDVGAQRAGQGERLAAGGGLGDHLEVVLEVQQGGERAPDEVLVVGQQDPNHAARTPQ